MAMSDKFWTEVSPSRFPWEKEALEYLRDNLPDHEPWRVWTNFQFIADDGSINEIDALVLSRVGLFLVEIKGHPGEASGDQGTLVFRDASGTRSIGHPLFLANLKAKRLKGLLQRQKAFRKSRVPFIEPLVFLSHATAIQLDSPADAYLALRDRAATEKRPGRDGVLAALQERKAPGLRRDPYIYGDRPLAKILKRALEDEMGVARIPGRRRIKDYDLGEVLEETQVYRDELGQHVSLPKTKRRIRRYFVPRDYPIDAAQIQRSAKREFQLLERLQHPGILRALDYTVDELGPAVFFEHLSNTQRMDRFLADHGERLDLDARLDLLRQVAEAVKYAHAQQVVHRCLSPQSVLVVHDKQANAVGVKVMNWSTGVRGSEQATSASVVSATLHPEAYQEEASAVYLAPELRQYPNSIAPTLDVFSLGALAFHIFTGRPPAENSDDLYEKVEGGGLQLSASEEGTLESVDLLVSSATEANVPRRLQSVDEFLQALDGIEEELTRPDDVCNVPPNAVAGDVFPDGTRVLRRLGSGATAVAFLVERGANDATDRFVLKVARTPDHSERMGIEARVLRQLSHPHLPRLVDDFQVGPYRGFLSKPANDQTLRQRLQAEGALQLEMLERFGDQLLDALAYLESVGISHRDVKPDNIAVTDFERKQAYGVVLFDFSLSGAPLDDLKVGTPAYTDPFLGGRPNRRWDLDAERFSAGVTLHEMATGVLPQWGDGRSDPRATEGEVVLDGNRFPSGVRESLLGFFRTALAREPGDRFDDAESMRRAWNAVYRETIHAPVVEASEDLGSTLDDRLGPLGVKTPLVELPLSTRAHNALDRLELFTVEQLLETPPGRLFQARGVGAKTRGELDALMRELRGRHPDVEIRTAADRKEFSSGPDALHPEEAFTGISVDELLALVRQGEGKTTKTETAALDALLGLDGDASRALMAPSQTEASGGLDISRQRFHQILARLRNRWSARPPVTALRADLDRTLERNNGIVTLREAAESLVAERGSAREGEEGLARAAALVRVASEAEGTDDAPRWFLRRRSGRVWIGRTDEHVRYAEDLAQLAPRLAKTQPLPSRDSVERALTDIARPESVSAIPPGRLARLAAAACPDVDLSGRGELYPVGLEAEEAVVLSVGALIGSGRPDPNDPTRRLVTIEEVQERIRSRYPRAAELPDRPALDGLLTRASWDVIWSEEDDAYRSRVGDALSLDSASSILPRFRTRVRPAEPVEADQAQAQSFEQLVTNTLAAGRFLVLKTAPRDLFRAAAELQHRFPEIELMNLDVELFSELEGVLASRGIDIELFFKAEEAGSRNALDWSRVQTVMTDVAGRITERLLASSAPICIHNVGLLARYDLWSPLETLNGLMSGRDTRPCLVLIPGGDSTTSTPTVDGSQIPILPGQSVVVPDAWLMNAHRAEPASS